MTNNQENINFHSEDTDFILDNEASYIDWVLKLAKHHQKALSHINYIFCSDEYLLSINKQYLNHDYFTDIITFPLNEDPIEADIFISIDRIKENSSLLGTTFTNELHRVMAHGILHMIGFNDKTEESKSVMRLKEDEALSFIAAS